MNIELCHPIIPNALGYNVLKSIYIYLESWLYVILELSQWGTYRAKAFCALNIIAVVRLGTVVLFYDWENVALLRMTYWRCIPHVEKHKKIIIQSTFFHTRDIHFMQNWCVLAVIIASRGTLNVCISILRCWIDNTSLRRVGNLTSPEERRAYLSSTDNYKCWSAYSKAVWHEDQIAKKKIWRKNIKILRLSRQNMGWTIISIDRMYKFDVVL